MTAFNMTLETWVTPGRPWMRLLTLASMELKLVSA